MALMLAKTYAAFKAAGAPDDVAEAAAEELAAYGDRLASIDARLGRIEPGLAELRTEVAELRTDTNARFAELRSDLGSRFTLLTWAVGIVAAATIANFGMLWQLASAIAALHSAIGGLHR